MIAVNKLIRNPYAWTNIMQERMEKALKELGYDDVVFYPEEDFFAGDNEFEVMMKFLDASMRWVLANKQNVDEFIFPDIECNPFGQLGFFFQDRTGLPFKFQTIVHCRADLDRYYKGMERYMHIHKKFDHFIFQLRDTQISFAHWGIPSHVTGGFLNRYDNQNVEKEFDVLWTAHRLLDPGKDPDRFMRIVQAHPELKFVAVIDRPHLPYIMTPNLTTMGFMVNEDLLALSRKCRYVLSTSLTETFGYTMMDAVSVGCIPVASDIPAHRELFPEKFIMKEDIADFTTTATDAELASIVAPHYYTESFRKLLRRT